METATDRKCVLRGMFSTNTNKRGGVLENISLGICLDKEKNSEFGNVISHSTKLDI
jgi:hypothetical protein